VSAAPLFSPPRVACSAGFRAGARRPGRRPSKSVLDEGRWAFTSDGVGRPATSGLARLFAQIHEGVAPGRPGLRWTFARHAGRSGRRGPARGVDIQVQA